MQGLKIGHLVKERLQMLSKYKGCVCGVVVEEKDGVEFPILGAVSLEGFGVKIKLFLEDGFINKVAAVSGREVIEQPVESIGLDNFNQALEVMVELLDQKTWGSKDWITFCSMDCEELHLHLVDCIQRKGKLLEIKNTLVDFGFHEIFCSVVFAKKNGIFYALLKENQKVCFAAEFESAVEGNRFYQGVEEDFFLSKKGNKIHRLSKEVFYEKFYIVKELFL